MSEAKSLPIASREDERREAERVRFVELREQLLAKYKEDTRQEQRGRAKLAGPKRHPTTGDDLGDTSQEAVQQVPATKSAIKVPGAALVELAPLIATGIALVLIFLV